MCLRQMAAQIKKIGFKVNKRQSDRITKKKQTHSIIMIRK